jgi:exoribonuclease R
MRNKKNKTLDSGRLSSAILDIFRHKPGRALNYKQVSSELGFSKEVERQRVQAVLSALFSKGQLESAEKGKFILKQSETSVTGIAEITASGSAYVIGEDREQDIYIPKRYVRGAWPGDLVRVVLWDNGRRNKPEGEIIEILKRGRTEFVGRLEVRKNFAVLVPDRAKAIAEIFIPPAKLKGGSDGDKAVVKVTDWDYDGSHASGEVVKIHGK